MTTPTPDELRKRAKFYGDKMAFLNVEREMLAFADAWKADRKRLEKTEVMVFALVESSDGMTRNQRKQWVDNVLGATADLKLEQTNVCPECGLPANGHSCPICTGDDHDGDT